MFDQKSRFIIFAKTLNFPEFRRVYSFSYDRFLKSKRVYDIDDEHQYRFRQTHISFKYGSSEPASPNQVSGMFRGAHILNTINLQFLIKYKRFENLSLDQTFTSQGLVEELHDFDSYEPLPDRYVEALHYVLNLKIPMVAQVALLTNVDNIGEETNMVFGNDVPIGYRSKNPSFKYKKQCESAVFLDDANYMLGAIGGDLPLSGTDLSKQVSRLKEILDII